MTIIQCWDKKKKKHFEPQLVPEMLEAQEVWANTAQSNLLFEVGWWEHAMHDA